MDGGGGVTHPLGKRFGATVQCILFECTTETAKASINIRVVRCDQTVTITMTQTENAWQLAILTVVGAFK